MNVEDPTVVATQLSVAALAAKFNSTRVAPSTKAPLTPEERQAAKVAIHATQRNGLCPCGCGKKAKKCENGRRVLEFRKYLR